MNRSGGVDGADAGFQSGKVRGGNEIGLVQQDHVGERDLFLRLRRSRPVLHDVLRIHDGDDGVEPESALHLVVGEKRLGDRAGVGQAGGFDQDVVELVLALEQVAEDADQVAAHGAADAAVVHLEDFFLGLDDQIFIDADLAEFVFDDGDAFAVLGGEDVVEQGGLAGAEKAGKDGDGDACIGHGGNSCRARGLMSFYDEEKAGII